MTGRNGNDAPRGQAMLETVFFLPVFLLALFGMLWAVRAAVQYERVQTAVRYSWAISQQQAPYLKYSFYAMYGQLGNPVPAPSPVACTSPLPDPLSDAAPTYTSTQTVTASQSFWTPSSSTLGCTSGYLGMYLNQAKKVDVLVNTLEPTIVSQVPVPAALQAVIGATSAPSTAQIFYQQIGVDGNMACYPDFSKMVTASLAPLTDSTTPATAPVAQNADAMYYTTGDSNGHVADYFPLSTACY